MSDQINPDMSHFLLLQYLYVPETHINARAQISVRNVVLNQEVNDRIGPFHGTMSGANFQ